MPHILVERGYAVAASFAFTALIQSAPIPGKIINGWLGEKLGRKLTIAGFMVLAAVGLLLFGSVTNPDTVRLYGFAMMFFGGGVFASLKIYWSEQYPTSLRGTGSGFVESCARFIGSVVSLAIMPVAMEKFGVNPPLVGVAIFLLVAALALLIVGKETKGKLLETVTEDAVQP
jgi:MFS transporter, putative metabolite:H+ symporter